MKATLIKLVLNVTPMMMTALLLHIDAKPAHAATCFTNLGNCYYRAAVVSGFWYRWAAGLDCELGLIRCVREEASGF